MAVINGFILESKLIIFITIIILIIIMRIIVIIRIVIKSIDLLL